MNRRLFLAGTVAGAGALILPCISLGLPKAPPAFEAAIGVASVVRARIRGVCQAESTDGDSDHWSSSVYVNVADICHSPDRFGEVCIEAGNSLVKMLPGRGQRGYLFFRPDDDRIQHGYVAGGVSVWAYQDGSRIKLMVRVRS